MAQKYRVVIEMVFEDEFGFDWTDNQYSYMRDRYEDIAGKAALAAYSDVWNHGRRRYSHSITNVAMGFKVEPVRDQAKKPRQTK